MSFFYFAWENIKEVTCLQVSIEILVSKYFEQINENNIDLGLDKNWLCPKFKNLRKRIQSFNFLLFCAV